MWGQGFGPAAELLLGAFAEKKCETFTFGRENPVSRAEALAHKYLRRR